MMRTSTLDGLVAAHPLERAGLQHPQDFGLRRRRHVADLVQEDGAAMALLELADALQGGAGEGAAFVAEEFAFQQLLRDGGAIDGQERLLAAVAVMIDGARDQFLARAALAGDKARWRRRPRAGR